jgi:hypothetical protein
MLREIRGRVSKQVTNGIKTALMDVIGFLCVSQSSFMAVYVADAHARVQRLVSVVKMAIMLEDCTAEEQRSVMRFSVGKRTQYKGYS